MTSVPFNRLEKLDTRLRNAWYRSQILHLVAGGLAFFSWAIPLFLSGIFVDWMTYMPAAGRVGIVAFILGVSLYRAWRCGWCKLQFFDAVAVALKLESHHGELNSLLVSAVQLRNQSLGSGGTSQMRDHTCQLAELSASGLRIDQAVPFTPLRRSVSFVSVLVAVVVIVSVVNGPFLAAGFSRFFTPWLNAEYPTYTQISIAPDGLVIKEGESASITARISGAVPRVATIYLQTGEGRSRAIELEVVDGKCTYTIASASRDFTYRIKAGDDRTDWQEARVVPAPRIQNVAVDLKYPAYLEREQESIEALTFTVPEGTGVDWHMVLDRPIQSARFYRDGEVAVDLDIGPDNQTIAFTADVSASKGYHFVWVDKGHGFEFTSPRYFLQVAADQPPRIELISPSANLVAMVGRPLKITARVQDDHGVGSAAVVYRVNQRDEVSIKLDGAVGSGQGEQAINWDYRKSEPDLQVGDMVSFAVEVSDRYPKPLGPHVVRSETRRITLLSRDQYLEQVEKQKDRLLSRVQSIYRQQRSAHKVVRTLEPSAEGYAQACQLEAIRQEMVRQQLKGIAGQLHVLLGDLAANDVSDVAEADSLEALRLALVGIADTPIAEAASRLREQSGAAALSEASGPQAASSAVNTAARDLGALVMQRGIDAAQEVYAREARMLAETQAMLRWECIALEAGADASGLAMRQTELAAWTTKLIADLQAAMRYQQRPLAVLRLIRSVKNLRDADTVERMEATQQMIVHGQLEKAAATQADLMRMLLDGEFSVRLSGAYSILLETRELLRSLGATQSQLRIRSTDLSGTEFKAQRESMLPLQQSLHKQLVTMLLPTVPAPRSQLFDDRLPKIPPVDLLVAKAGDAMAETLLKLREGDQVAVVRQQRTAEETLAELSLLVDNWSVEIGLRTQGLGTVVATSSSRMSSVEDYEARIIGYLEKTDLAAADEKPVQGIAESQQTLIDELDGFVASLKNRDQTDPDPDLPPFLNQLQQAEDYLQQSVQALQENDADSGIAFQEQAADALANAFEIVVAQNERLSLLQDLLLFQRSVGFASGYMEDIVAEQRDLLKLTEASQMEAMNPVMPQFRNMLRCLEDVSPLLDMVAARLDVGTPLAFAQTDFEDAIAAIEAGDKFDAVDAQDVAAESLSEVKTMVSDIRKQTGYVAEIVAFLHESVSEAAMLQFRQDDLRTRTSKTDLGGMPRILEMQQKLLAEAQVSSRKLFSATGMPSLNEPVDVMQEVMDALQETDGATAAETMELVSAIYAENAESLLAVITMLHGLPSIEIVADSDPALVRLVDALALASEQKKLLRQMPDADEDLLEQLASQQSKLAEQLNEISDQGAPHSLLAEAAGQLSDSVKMFEDSDRVGVIRHQKIADEKLRHFIIDQALILETAAPVAAASEGDADSGEGSDSESAVSAGFISDFVSGETAKDKRSEWKVLGDRNRAALNQNFARELPLEYRALLKNYYERVAK